MNFCSLFKKLDCTELEEEPSREWGSEAGSGQATVLSERWDRASQWLQYLPAEGQQQVWSHCGYSQYTIIVHVPGTCNYTFYMYMYMDIFICFALSCWEIFWIYRRFFWLVHCKCICKWASDIIETFLIFCWSIISPHRRWKDHLNCMFDLLITSDLQTVTSFRAFCVFKRYKNQSTMSWWLYW